MPGIDLTSIFRDDFPRLSGVYIDGIEVTQSIQYYKSAQHLTDVNDVRPDNSVQFVGGKPAWVRVYMRPVLFPEVTGVTGRLTVERRTAGIYWVTVAQITPQGGGDDHGPLDRRLCHRAGEPVTNSELRGAR